MRSWLNRWPSCYLWGLVIILITRRCVIAGHHLRLKTINQLLNIVILSGLGVLNRRLAVTVLMAGTAVGRIHCSIVTL